MRVMMRQECHQSQVQLLQRIGGIGPLVAALFILGIGDIKRFKTFDQLNRFTGFCPDTNSSGEHETHEPFCYADCKTGVVCCKSRPLPSLQRWQDGYTNKTIH